MTAPDRYSSPLAERYASTAMLELWSPQTRHGYWRRLWLALAEAEQELGVPIPDEAIAQMRAHLDDIDFDAVAAYEKRFRHDVMAHVHAFGDVAPAAKGFIHYGATSAFVTDNGDLILMRRGLELLRQKVVRVLRALAAFAREWRAEPTLGSTHLQPAQPTTVGKRATLWMQDLVLDLADLGVVAAEDLEEARLRAGGALHATAGKRRDAVIEVGEIEEQVLHPEGRPFADCRQLGGLKMRVAERRLVAPANGKRSD
jgi:adenylosuccinate lyase